MNHTQLQMMRELTSKGRRPIMPDWWCWPMVTDWQRKGLVHVELSGGKDNPWAEFVLTDKGRAAAIEHGCAAYDQTTGEWRWK